MAVSINIDNGSSAGATKNQRDFSAADVVQDAFQPGAAPAIVLPAPGRMGSKSSLHGLAFPDVLAPSPRIEQLVPALAPKRQVSHDLDVVEQASPTSERFFELHAEADSILSETPARGLLGVVQRYLPGSLVKRRSQLDAKIAELSAEDRAQYLDERRVQTAQMARAVGKTYARSVMLDNSTEAERKAALGELDIAQNEMQRLETEFETAYSQLQGQQQTEWYTSRLAERAKGVEAALSQMERSFDRQSEVKAKREAIISRFWKGHPQEQLLSKAYSQRQQELFQARERLELAIDQFAEFLGLAPGNRRAERNVRKAVEQHLMDPTYGRYEPEKNMPGRELQTEDLQNLRRMLNLEQWRGEG